MAATPVTLRAPRGARSRSAETMFRVVAASAAGALLVVLVLMLLSLGRTAGPAIHQRGTELVTGKRWAPSAGVFGGLPFVFGTVVTAAVAIVIAVPVALGTALFVSEMAPRRVRAVVAPLLDLLAAVPSVVYGLWGVFVLVPLLRPFEQWLGNTLGKVIPLFRPPAPGMSFLTAGILLAIMILPTISAVTREVFLKVPRDQREAALALGATRWETIRTAVLPAARGGIIGAIILGLGRALGETIAVTLVIGNEASISGSLLSPGYTIPSVIANELGEASGVHISALIALGLLLFAVTLGVNLLARAIIARKRFA